MIKLIAFDLNGVLLKSGRLVSENLMSFINKPYSLVKKQYLKYSVGAISREEFWKSVGIGIAEGEKNLSERVKLNVDVELISELSKKYILAILSNLPREWIDLLFFNRTSPSFFKYVVISGEVGVRKPDRKIYLRLLSESNIPPEEVLFVDDKKSNLMVAKDLGMKTVWMKGRDDAPFEPDFIIDSLEELPGVLEKLQKALK
jgi:putative hydrolase of the HAD superfamily